VYHTRLSGKIPKELSFRSGQDAVVLVMAPRGLVSGMSASQCICAGLSEDQ
jgi:hypothetical protein